MQSPKSNPETTAVREYTREEMREASQNNYNAGASQAAKLASLLDKFAGDLANDLEWALSWMDLNAPRLGSSIQDARRYADARTHLKARRLYEKAWDNAGREM